MKNSTTFRSLSLSHLPSEINFEIFLYLNFEEIYNIIFGTNSQSSNLECAKLFPNLNDFLIWKFIEKVELMIVHLKPLRHLQHAQRKRPVRLLLDLKPYFFERMTQVPQIEGDEIFHNQQVSKFHSNRLNFTVNFQYYYMRFGIKQLHQGLSKSDKYFFDMDQYFKTIQLIEKYYLPTPNPYFYKDLTYYFIRCMDAALKHCCRKWHHFTSTVWPDNILERKTESKLKLLQKLNERMEWVVCIVKQQDCYLKQKTVQWFIEVASQLDKTIATHDLILTFWKITPNIESFEPLIEVLHWINGKSSYHMVVDIFTALRMRLQRELKISHMQDFERFCNLLKFLRSSFLDMDSNGYLFNEKSRKFVTLAIELMEAIMNAQHLLAPEVHYEFSQFLEKYRLEKNLFPSSSQSYQLYSRVFEQNSRSNNGY
ncbi:hypothetical protein C9374_010764 [Naegleria lovaniensis]|uniref:F-box domain-containing protein n=1 Tax=Naegleria lovaniensis TaxID=51637 RepID=A0AA88KD74_NAELO|nr:uncharacterized protein C9374_010764 [Naegleria lovaniensis]KAG2374480.1 hypothetical protein C9374_010764 [Naegleria lovaniensis]